MTISLTAAAFSTTYSENSIGSNAVLKACGSGGDTWTMRNQTVDGRLVANDFLNTRDSSNNFLGCPGPANCHEWSGPAKGVLGDRNMVFYLVGDRNSFQLQAFPVTKSCPINKGGAPPGWCVQPCSGGVCMQSNCNSSQAASNFAFRAATDREDAFHIVHLATKKCLAFAAPPPSPPLPPGSCDSLPWKNMRHCDPTSSPDLRARDALARMTPAEKVARLAHDPAAGTNATAMPTYEWGVEGQMMSFGNCISLANGTDLCPPTFPAPTGLGCTFNVTLIEHIGSLVGDSVRALDNFNRAAQSSPRALSVRGPYLNLIRDPRDGRNQVSGWVSE